MQVHVRVRMQVRARVRECADTHLGSRNGLDDAAVEQLDAQLRQALGVVVVSQQVAVRTHVLVQIREY